MPTPSRQIDTTTHLSVVLQGLYARSQLLLDVYWDDMGRLMVGLGLLNSLTTASVAANTMLHTTTLTAVAKTFLHLRYISHTKTYYSTYPSLRCSTLCLSIVPPRATRRFQGLYMTVQAEQLFGEWSFSIISESSYAFYGLTTCPLLIDEKVLCVRMVGKRCPLGCKIFCALPYLRSWIFDCKNFLGDCQ